MPAPELDPKVPGEQSPTTQQDPNADEVSIDELQALAALKGAEVIAALKALTDPELVHLAEIEAAGSSRVTVLRAIEAELARGTEPVVAPVEQALAGRPGPAAPPGQIVRVDTQPRPVLTDAGWVIPEPIPTANPKL